MSGDMVNELLNDPRWELQIPLDLKKELLPIPTEEIKYRLVKKQASGSAYIHYKGIQTTRGRNHGGRR